MPVPKALAKQADLVDRVAELLEIDRSLVFLDTLPLSSGRTAKELHITEEELEARLTKNRSKRKNTLRVWTGNMDSDEKDRIRSLKDEVKALCATENTKVALSARHPHGDDGQIMFERRRRQSRSVRYKNRNAKVED